MRPNFGARLLLTLAARRGLSPRCSVRGGYSRRKPGTPFRPSPGITGAAFFSLPKRIEKFIWTRIGERFTLRICAARLPRVPFPTQETAKPRNSKARQWRAVQSGVNRAISFLWRDRPSPKSAPKSSGKTTFPQRAVLRRFSGPSQASLLPANRSNRLQSRRENF